MGTSSSSSKDRASRIYNDSNDSPLDATITGMHWDTLESFPQGKYKKMIKPCYTFALFQRVIREMIAGVQNA